MAEPLLPPKLLARLEVEEFYGDYIACLDEARIEEWPDFFAEEASYRVVSRENWEAGLPISIFLCRNRRQIQDRVASYLEANIYPDQWNRHLISAVQLTDVRENEIFVASNYGILQTRQDGETRIYQSGRCYDRLVRTDGRLRIHSRELVYDTHAVATLFVMPI